MICRCGEVISLWGRCGLLALSDRIRGKREFEDLQYFIVLLCEM